MPRKAILSLATVPSVLACVSAAPRWEDRPVPTDDAVESILGIRNASCFERDLLPPEHPVMPRKEHLRPCCAFGYALRSEERRGGKECVSRVSDRWWA